MSDLVLLLVEWLSSHQMMLNNSAFPGEAAVKRKVDKKISNSKVIAIKGRSAIFFPNVIIVTIKIWKKSTFLNWLHLEKAGMSVYVYFLLIPSIQKKKIWQGKVGIYFIWVEFEYILMNNKLRYLLVSCFVKIEKSQ